MPGNAGAEQTLTGQNSTQFCPIQLALPMTRRAERTDYRIAKERTPESSVGSSLTDVQIDIHDYFWPREK